MDELIERLRERAEFEDKRVLDEAKALGFVPEVYSGSQTGALLREAAAALEAAREDAELAAKWRFCTTEHLIEGDEVIKCHINVGVNVWQGPEWVAFYECSPDELQAAIDQARGKGGGEVG